MFCRAELVRLQKNLADIESLATVLAVSPTLPADGRQLERELGLGFRLLSDRDARVAGQYGLAYEDENLGRIPRPTTIVLDRNGKVVWSHIADSLTDRAEPDEVLDVLRSL